MHPVSPDDAPYDNVAGLVSPRYQIRRAWVVLSISLTAFLLLASGLTAVAFWTYQHATVAEYAQLSVASGTTALVRSRAEEEWRTVGTGARIREGDTISTTLGTVVLIAMFDGSTIEIAEDSIITLDRMRSSRFVERTKLIALSIEHGALYLTMAPSGRYQYSEMVVRHHQRRVVMSDDRQRDDAGVFLVELTPVGSDGKDATMRTAVIQGAVLVWTEFATLRLHADQQVHITEHDAFSPITRPVRELIQNGSFASAMDRWLLFEQRSPRQSASKPTGATVGIVETSVSDRTTHVLEFARSQTESEHATQIGVRQHIGKSLRVPSTLMLNITLKISSQYPVGGGDDLAQFPCNVRIVYLDKDGQEREWSHGFYIAADAERPVDGVRATKIAEDEWQQIGYDLRNLEPEPRQIVAIVVYASGQSFQTQVANISLTSSELIDKHR